MKKVFVLGLALLLLGAMSRKTQASTFFDDFNDGNADGWIAAPPYGGAPSSGNWRVEDGKVTQDEGGDHYNFLLENHLMSDQTIEVNALWNERGHIGLTVWRKDYDNWVYIMYPPWGVYFYVIEKWCDNGSPYCGRDTNVTYSFYPFSGERKWQAFKVEANSSTGELGVYLDNVLQFTHTVGPNTKRTGLSGFNSSNAGGWFDDFRVTVPDPDIDEDGVSNDVDNCPEAANPGQEDMDGDGEGDVCDLNLDGDVSPNNEDCAPNNLSTWRLVLLFEDEDGDEVTTGSGVQSCIGSDIPMGWVETQNGEDCAPDNAGVMVKVGTRSCKLWSDGVRGEGILTAPGTQKPAN